MRKKLSLFVVACLLAGCSSSKLTVENANKLKEGMPEAEIATLLGEPTKKESTDFFGKQVTIFMYHEEGKPQVTVFCADGKAAGAAVDGKTLFGKVTPGK